jgi:ABC-type sugar transport system substrate-binding protein
MIIQNIGDKYLITIEVAEFDNIQREFEKAKETGAPVIVLQADVTEEKKLKK